jgi:hypothetical protein
MGGAVAVVHGGPTPPGPGGPRVRGGGGGGGGGGRGGGCVKLAPTKGGGVVDILCG